MRNQQNNDYLDRVKLDYSISRSQDLASAIIHMVGFGMNFSILALLIVFSALDGNSIKIVSFALYGSFCNIYFIFSVLYHALANPIAKKVFRIFEVASKYLLVAGVSIPLSLIVLGGNLGWIFFYLFTGLCLIGIILVTLNKSSRRIYLLIVNILLALVVLVYVVLSYNVINPGLKLWFSIASLLLVMGVALKEMKGISFHHAISHFCYIVASVCIFFGFFFHLL